MAIAAPAAAGLALFVSILAAQLLPFLDQSSATTAAQGSQLHGVALLMLFAVMQAALFTAVYVVYRERHAPHADHRRRLSEVVVFFSCVSAVLLHFLLFVQEPAAVGALDGDASAAAHALGLAARRGLPASATVTFFLGVALVYLHVGTGGGGGGGNVPIPEPEPVVRILTEIALEAAAALVVMMAMAAAYIT